MTTEEEREAIAERAAEKALEKIYAEVGRNVVRKFLWVVGLIALGLLTWMAASGKLPPPGK